MSIRSALTHLTLEVVAKVTRPLSEEARFALLVRFGRVLLPQYRFKWPHMQWWQDEEFTEYLRTFGEVDGFNTDRRLMVHELLRLTAGISGDTAECGVFQGAGSYLICVANTGSELRIHHVFDSFEGMSPPTEEDGEYWRAASMAFSFNGVQRNLEQFERVEYHKGWIPTRFADVADRVFSFVHIDVDLAGPTRDSIEFFYPRMSKGGIIVCDDYGFTTCPGATRAIDEYLSDKPEKMIRLSAGGGFLIKGTTTGEPPLSFRQRSKVGSEKAVALT